MTLGKRLWILALRNEVSTDASPGGADRKAVPLFFGRLHGGLLAGATPQAPDWILRGYLPLDPHAQHIAQDADLRGGQLVKLVAQFLQEPVRVLWRVDVDDELPLRCFSGLVEGELLFIRQVERLGYLVDEISGGYAFQTDLDGRDVGLVVADEFGQLRLADAMPQPQFVQQVGEGTHVDSDRVLLRR